MSGLEPTIMILLLVSSDAATCIAAGAPAQPAQHCCCSCCCCSCCCLGSAVPLLNGCSSCCYNEKSQLTVQQCASDKCTFCTDGHAISCTQVYRIPGLLPRHVCRFVQHACFPDLRNDLWTAGPDNTHLWWVKGRAVRAQLWLTVFASLSQVNVSTLVHCLRCCLHACAVAGCCPSVHATTSTSLHVWAGSWCLDNH